MVPRLNLVGQKIHMLTVLEMVGLNKWRNSIWKCQCDCGKIVVRTLEDRKRLEKVASCGCYNSRLNSIKAADINERSREKTLGHRFGKITVLEMADIVGGHRRWKCRCDCGKELVMRIYRDGKHPTKSCGCDRKGWARSLSARPTGVSLKQCRKRTPEDIMKSYLKGALKRNLEWTLTEEQVGALVSAPCHYCGLNAQPTNGIDRLDNDKGYILSNVVTCCVQCNMAKRNLSKQDFVDWIMRCAEHLRVS